MPAPERGDRFPVTVRIFETIGGPEKTKEIWAFKRMGFLCMHECLGYSQSYTVTHIPTGLAIAGRIDKRTGLRLIELIHAWPDWDQIKTKEDALKMITTRDRLSKAVARAEQETRITKGDYRRL